MSDCAPICHHGTQAVPHEVPGTHVGGFFLRPYDLGSPVVPGQDGDELFLGPWVQLLDPYDGHVIKPSFLLRYQEVEGDFAAREHDTANLGGGDVVIDHLLERTVGQLLDGAVGLPSSQVSLGREKDERFADREEHLAAEQMEKLPGSGHVGHADVVFGAQLEKPFDACRRMLGPWPS